MDGKILKELSRKLSYFENRIFLKLVDENLSQALCIRYRDFKTFTIVALIYIDNDKPKRFQITLMDGKILKELSRK